MNHISASRNKCVTNARQWYFLIIIAWLVLGACANQSKREPYDPTTCLEIVPNHVKGLQIMEGPRSKKSIIQDMVFPLCNGRVLFKRMQSNSEEIAPGRVVFRVVVEYTGEVIAVSIEESTIKSNTFLRKMSDFIMDTDFVTWARNDTDAVFLYPVDFY